MVFLVIPFVLITIIAVILYISSKLKPKKFPPGPKWKIPFIGNSWQLRKLSKELGGQHKAMEKLCEVYSSNVIGLKLGTELVIYARSYEIVKEIHTREAFDGRPDNFFLRLRTMGTRLGITCTDGNHWHEQRSFCMRQLKNIGYGKSKMEFEIQNALFELCDEIERMEGKSFWPGEDLLAQSVINILWTFTTGMKISRNDPRLLKFLNLLHKRSKLFDMSGGTLSQFPILRFLAPEKSGYTLIKNLNQEFYNFFMEIVNEHIETFSEDKSSDDLIYAFLSEMQLREKDQSSTFQLRQLVMIILDIFIAGSQTTSTTIDLALMMMIVRPDIKQKCVEEISANLKNGEDLNYANRFKFNYIQAFLLEVQRFFHIIPITGPRRVLKTCNLGGYEIPRNTTVLIGLKSVHMDEEFWKEPEVFKVERFLDENSNFIKSERVLSFGAGRRKCLGDQLAKACIFTFFVGIVQAFELKSDSKFPPSLDLLPGITLSPKKYKIIFSKRKI